MFIWLNDPTIAKPQTVQIPVPFLNNAAGAGDLVARMTAAIGMPHCIPCQERQALMNQLLQFKPWGNW